jgi:hypothetical protein
LISDWRPDEVTPELAKKLLELKCANLDGPYSTILLTPEHSFFKLIVLKY